MQGYLNFLRRAPSSYQAKLAPAFSTQTKNKTQALSSYSPISSKLKVNTKKSLHFPQRPNSLFRPKLKVKTKKTGIAAINLVCSK